MTGAGCDGPMLYPAWNTSSQLTRSEEIRRTRIHGTHSGKLIGVFVAFPELDRPPEIILDVADIVDTAGAGRNAFAVALHFMYYVHETLRVTPAMEAKVSDHVGRWKRLRNWRTI
jgi:hypothetical protein